MPRIPLVDTANPDPAVSELLEWVERVEGHVPNHFLIELHFPEHFKAWLQWVRTLWDAGELSFSEVQHVGIAVSKANACAYCAGSFCSVLEHGGGRDRAEVEAYLRDDVATLPERERVIVGFAVKVNDDPHGMTDEDITRLRDVGLTEKGIVQVVWLVNMFSSSNRINTVFATELDAENAYQTLATSLIEPGGLAKSGRKVEG